MKQKQTQAEDKNKTMSGTALRTGIGLGRWEGMDYYECSHGIVIGQEWCPGHSI